MLQLSQPLPLNDLSHREEGREDCCQQGSHVRRAVVEGSEKSVPYGKDGRPMPPWGYYKDSPSQLLESERKMG